MAPSLVETTNLSLRAAPVDPLKTDAGHNKENVIGYGEAYKHENELKGTEKQPPASFPNYLPVWDNETERYPPLQPFEHYDHGKDADPSFPDLLPKDKAVLDDITPTIGTEVRGVQLSQLTKEGKDQLALYVAQRKVVAFRDQDFAHLPIDKALEFGGYFGRHHIHQTSGAPKGYPEIHLVHRGADDRSGSEFLAQRTNTITWHSDVTFEKQPPGTTFLYILDGPTSGGDTLFADMAQAYKRLSPEFRKRLHGLKAVHSGIEQVNNSLNKGGIARRDPITSEHPIVRTHPVTGEKALFVNPQFTRYIVGYKKEESDYLLKFLFDHIALSQDLQARVRWHAGTVVVWDNRLASHSALFDWEDGQRRHHARITPQAEAPYETPFEA
ncbi:alpha-ketoglutarate-dependent taurine dioxygenase [Aspergillus heteromorphus CBS 117.55]|uniref:Alpha-ketoglutarate-dependent taurine dioxygenase n=1 Tax=Aspergillus heteromorphus CBS 117.55 TaxID=1448321 RepID=A0A317X263_9EURO|nr:alpha-ketoglutarate-dependent taurine dioxygenase [Aspergillus heteromorphus CBS 117.55]PWY92689.1 alpha-ketoglutarate-dependent taurine dioxygenase [Aspergillus heteromorphus CBS 117.55]